MPVAIEQEENTLYADVVVVGGGSAGVAAAIGAARFGARVVLIEKSGFWGGKATAALVGTICGAYYRSENKNSKYVGSGFVQEFCEQVKKRSNNNPVAHYAGNLHFLPYEPFALLRTCDELIEAEKNIVPMLHTILSSVSFKDGRLGEIEVSNNGDCLKINAQKLIDCSGESVVSRLAAFPVFSQEEYQASAIVFSMENVDASDPINLSLVMIKKLHEACEQGELDHSLKKISIVPASLKEGRVMLKLALPYRITDQLNSKTTVEMQGRKDLERVAGILNKTVGAFSKARIGVVAAEVGTRTARLSKGKQVLTEQEVLECRKHSEGIAKGAWPIEKWKLDGKVSMDFFALDDHYDIPAACLESEFSEDLYFAGRNFSATFDAMASARVIGTCLSTGYAAGYMAAGAIKGEKREETIANLRKQEY